MAKVKRKTTASTAKKATNVQVRRQSGSDNTFFATWDWGERNTDKYDVLWRYWTPNNIWFIGSETSENYKQSTYSPPANATRIAFKVKPVAKDKGDKKKTPYWNAEWTKDLIIPITGSWNQVAIEPPPVPEVSISAFTLTADLSIYNTPAKYIDFQVIKDDVKVAYNGHVPIKTNRASWTTPVEGGGRYKVRARCYVDSSYVSEWSEYSDNVTTKPGSVSKITSIKTVKNGQTNQVEVWLTWPALANSTDGYTVEYTVNKSYFNANPDGVQSVEITVGTTAIITGLDQNGYRTYYFRVRGKNSEGEGGWSPIAQIAVGATASAPTTWSYTSVVKIGEGAVLNWAHNCADGSDQTKAQMQEWVNGGPNSGVPVTTRNFTTQTSFTQPTGGYNDGTYVTWRVRTAGANGAWGDWSTVRRFDVIAPPSIQLAMYDAWKWKWNPFRFATDTIYTADGDYGNRITTLTHYPFVISAVATPATQEAIAFNLDILSDESYETFDGTGVSKIVTAGESIYSKYIVADSNRLRTVLTPGDLSLENNISYTVHITVAMDSGLTAEADYHFNVAYLDDDEYIPDAYVYLDDDTLQASIQPFCTDPEGNQVTDVTLSVYRREYNGAFTLIEKDIPGPSETTVIDPHPALDYARYRIVAMSNRTGLVNYYDIPALELGYGSIVMQWDEEWTYFNTDLEEELSEPPWSGSMLKLPYNIDITVDQAPDVSLINYIGRSHPVSYYGTQKGETTRWQCEVPKSDTETIYSLRRLAAYSGDVYVREPSGIGYWAQVNASYSMNHNKMTVPVTFTITRVEGGV